MYLDTQFKAFIKLCIYLPNPSTTGKIHQKVICLSRGQLVYFYLRLDHTKLKVYITGWGGEGIFLRAIT